MDGLIPFTVDQPDLFNLRKIHLHLVTQLPYENLSVYYDTPHKLTTRTNSLQNKLTSNRGGFCLELNTIYYEILLSYGYQVRKYSSCVLLGWQGEDRKDTHQTLIVTINEKEYLCDIGASEFTPLEPVLIPTTSSRVDVEQCFSDPLTTFDDVIFHDVRVSGGTLGKLSLAKFQGTHTICFQIKKCKDQVYLPFFIVRQSPSTDEYFEEMCLRLATPATCPPRPYFTEFVTLPLLDGSRKTLIGSKDGGYTFWERDVQGFEKRKIKYDPGFNITDLVWKEFSLRL